MKIRTRLACLGLGLALLTLAGCDFRQTAGGQAIAPPTPAPTAGDTASARAGGQLYAIPGGEGVVVDAEGNVVLRGNRLAVLRDCLTGMPQAITDSRYAPPKDGKGARQVLSALYAPDGTLLADWQPVSYGAGVG